MRKKIKHFWDKLKDFKKRFSDDHDLIGFKFCIGLVIILIGFWIDGR